MIASIVNSSRRKQMWSHMAKMLMLFICMIPLYGFGEFIFSNKEYSKNMEVEWYLVPQELVCSVFNKTDPELLKKHVHLKVGKVDEANKQLLERGYYGEAYLVIHVKNNGGLAAWGELNCKLIMWEERGEEYEFDLLITHMGRSHIFVYHLTVGLDKEPTVQFHWNKLYTKG